MDIASLTFTDYDHPDPDSHNGQDHAQHAKRRKISLACEQCRTRKARCDGSKPVCGNCLRRGEQCVYKVTKAQMDTTQDYVDSLLSKITALEEENARLREQKAVDERDIVTRMLVQSGRPVHTFESPSSGTHSSSPGGPGRLAVTKKLSDVDAMGAAVDPNRRQSARSSYFGSSSTSSLMNQVLKAIGDGGELSAAARASSSLPVGIDNATFEADFAGPENFSLFPRPITDLLLNRYWEKVHLLYPFVHKPTFMQSYERLWTSNSPPAPDNPALGLGESGSAGPLSFSFHCALNAMLILGLQFTNLPAQEKDTLTFQCLQKCKNLIKVDLLNEASLAVLQMLLLLGHYFQSTTSPNKCWNIVGLACRISQSLGLHVDGMRPSQMPPLERELRRRAWYSCVILDMIIAMALGRPVMLRRHHIVPLPEPTDDEYLLHHIPQPSNHLSNLMFFHETIKMYKIMRDSLAELFKDQPGTEAQKLDKTVELDAKLLKLQDELPDSLHWDRSVPTDLRANKNVLEQQRHVLHLRFLAARLGIHRPLFVDYCRMSRSSRRSDDPLPTTDLVLSFARSAAVACVRASLHLVEIVDIYASTEATCEWWYNMFFIRMAAAIFMITMTQPDLLKEVGCDKLENAWQICKGTLQNKLPVNEPVKNCLEGLETMYTQVKAYANANANANAMAAVDVNQAFTSTSFTDGTTAIGIEAGGFAFLDAGMLNLGPDEWGFGFDDYTGQII